MRKSAFTTDSHLRDWAGALLYLFDLVIPKRNSVVIATFPDADDQGASLCHALQKADWRGGIVWLTWGDPKDLNIWQQNRGLGAVPIRFVRRLSPLGVWLFLRARWVFYTHGLYFNYAPPAGKTVVNLWHGMPIKRIWKGVPNASKAPESTLLASTSPFFSEVLMKASGFASARLIECGLPRNDYLTDVRQEVKDLARRLRGDSQRLLMFLPTYRQSKVGYITEDGLETGSILGMSRVEAEQLHAWLIRSKSKLLVKPHPMSIHLNTVFPNDDHWLMVDDKQLMEWGVGLYEILSQVELLITDISSVYVDFLITERPQIIYFPDIDHYRRTRGVLLDPLEDYMPGPVARNYKQMESALDDHITGIDALQNKRRELKVLLNPDRPEKSANMILNATGVLSNARTPHVAVIWAQFGPYHFSRLQALRECLGPDQILGVEISSRTTTYAWQRERGAGAGLVTLIPGRTAEEVTISEIYHKALMFFRARRIDVVFAPSYWPASSLAIILAARNAGARVVMMNDSHAHTAKARGVWADVKRRLVLQFDAALVAGAPQKDYFAGMGLDPGKIVTGYDAVDNEHFSRLSQAARTRGKEVRAKHGLPERYFLNVGRMVWKKNLETLVDAYRKVKSSMGPECPRLVLVGSGKLERNLRERCLRHGLSVWQAAGKDGSARSGDADVLFHGFRQIDELPDFYALADCFILPSREEEWGLVVNEAMACGLPVLVSRVAGCARDLVHEGENGFLFDPFDAAALAAHLERIAREPELAKRLGAASQRIIADWGCERFATAAQEAAEIALGKKIGNSRPGAMRGLVAEN